MGQVENKNIILLLRYAVKCVDRSLIDHGSRTAYILYKMLQKDGRFEQYEMADYAVFATFHDIASMPLFGYLFLKELSPFREEATILLNYYENDENHEKVDFSIKNVAAYIFLADCVATYYITRGSAFDIYSLRQYEGVRFTKDALDLLEGASKKIRLLDALEDETYLKELDELLEYVVFGNEDEEKYLDMIIYCLSLKEERYALDTVACMCICEELGLKMYLTQEQRETLKYAALIHDMGMLMIPQELVNAPRKLTNDEKEKIEKHIEITEDAWRMILPTDIVEVALAHHERGNGFGYPRRLKARDMNIMQRILQVGDTVTALISERSYRQAKDKNTIQTILKEGSNNGSFSTEVVNNLIRNYDNIMNRVNKKKEQVLQTRASLQKDYKELKNK